LLKLDQQELLDELLAADPDSDKTKLRHAIVLKMKEINALMTEAQLG